MPSPAFCLAMLALAVPCGAQESPSSAPESTSVAGVLDNRSCRTDYEIHARVERATKALSGRETITWHNRTADEVTDLWFHLYLNAFSNTETIHLRESQGKLRGVELKDGYGWQRITSIKVAGRELVGGLEFRTPDSDPEDASADAEDRSVCRVPLHDAVAPDETIAIELTWESQLPRVRRRTGYKGDYLFIAQWFPKLGVYEGGRGWNCHSFHASTEFYADFGTFDVTLDLPGIYEGKVGGSGVLVQERKTGEGRYEVQFQAPSMADREYVDATGKLPLVHDFAWTADPRYLVRKYAFRYDEWADLYADQVEDTQGALGPDKDLALRPVDVTVLVHPERESQAQRHYEATATALFFYGLWFGEYPYEHVTVVDPAWGGRASGGMEYPTLFTCGTALFTTPDMYRPESVTVHEAGHQFWYGLVGNNEFEAAWLDEGFNSYADSEALVRHYGPRRATTAYSGLFMNGTRLAERPGGNSLAKILSAEEWKLYVDADWWPKEARKSLHPLKKLGFVEWWRDQPLLTLAPGSDDPRWGDRAGYLRDPDSDPVDTDAWLYVDRNSYRTNSYPRPAAVLRSMTGVIGRDAFLKGMRHYSEEWRYRHPYPQDFFDSFIEGSGVDVSWYFEDLFQDTKTLDWGVSVSQRRKPKARGYFQDPDNGEFRKLEPDENGDDEEELDDDTHSGVGEVQAADSRPDSPGAESTVADGTPPENGESDSEDDEAEDEKRPWLTDVVVKRKGELRLPLEILITYEDGTQERRRWTREEQAESTWLRIEGESESKLRSVVLDPERLYYLDRDMSDNQWYDEVDHVAPLRWAERVLTQYSHLLQWQSGIGG